MFVSVAGKFCPHDNIDIGCTTTNRLLELLLSIMLPVTALVQ
jgi:hypothetical protein